MGIIILNGSLAFGTNKEQGVLLVSSNFWTIQSDEEFIYAEILIAASMMAVHVFYLIGRPPRIKSAMFAVRNPTVEEASTVNLQWNMTSFFPIFYEEFMALGRLGAHAFFGDGCTGDYNFLTSNLHALSNGWCSASD